MIIYRFLNARYGLQALQTRHLKVGRLGELNDPMDCAPRIVNYPPRNVDLLNERFEQSILLGAAATIGLLCFSAAVHDPVVWSHYADAHRGIALGFAFEGGARILPVKYRNERAELDYTALDLPGEAMNTMVLEQGFTTKAASWSYEQEHRMFIDLDHCKMEGEHYFLPMPEIAFIQVVLGARCGLIANDIIRLLRAESKVGVFRASKNEKFYRMDLAGEPAATVN